MAVDQHVVRTQGRVVDGPERGCCEKSHRAGRSTNAGRTSLRRVLTTSLPSCAAQEGVTRDRLSSSVCHRGSRETKPHRIRTGGITSLGRFGRAEMEMSVRRLMSVLYDPQRSSGCTQLHGLTGRGRRRRLSVRRLDMMGCRAVAKE
jgi:hypothetical protein